MYAASLNPVYRPVHTSAAQFSAVLDFALTTDEIFDLYNNAPCGCYSLDSDGIFARINNTTLKWLGYTRDEIVGHIRFADLLTCESRERFCQSFHQFKLNGTIRELELTVIGKNGAPMEILLSSTAIFNERGEFTASRCMIFDITERKKIEATLREREGLIGRVLNASPDFVYVYDTNTHQNVFTNRETTTLLGYCPSDATVAGDAMFNTLVHPDDLPKVAAHIARVLALPDGDVQETEYRVRRADGTYHLLTTRDTVFARDKHTHAVTQYLGVARYREKA